MQLWVVYRLYPITLLCPSSPSDRSKSSRLAQRLWEYLVHQESLTETFIRYIFYNKVSCFSCSVVVGALAEVCVRNRVMDDGQFRRKVLSPWREWSVQMVLFWMGQGACIMRQSTQVGMVCAEYWADLSPHEGDVCSCNILFGYPLCKWGRVALCTDQVSWSYWHAWLPLLEKKNLFASAQTLPPVKVYFVLIFEEPDETFTFFSCLWQIFCMLLALKHIQIKYVCKVYSRTLVDGYLERNMAPMSVPFETRGPNITHAINERCMAVAQMPISLLWNWEQKLKYGFI